MAWILALGSWLLVATLLAEESPTPRGLLFEVQVPGASARSYLFGTIHSEDARVIEPPPPVRSAFETSPGFALEVVPDGPALIKAMMTMTYTDGRQLLDVLPPAMHQATRAALAELGMSEEAYRDFKPWAIMTQLSTPPPVTGEFLDMRLYRLALAQRKRILGLETMDEQLAIFDDLSTEDQIALLRETLEARDRLPLMSAVLNLKNFTQIFSRL